MKRLRGIGEVEIIVVLVVIAALIGTHWWAYGSGKGAGRDEEKAAWQKRELEQQQTYAAEIKRLRDEKDAQLAALQGKLAGAEADFEKKRKEHQDAKARNDRFDRGVRDGSIVLVDPGAGEARGSPGAAGAAPAGGCDGAPSRPGRLSPRLAEFLFSEADRADAVIEDLEDRLALAQGTVTAYYELAKGCSGGTQ